MWQQKTEVWPGRDDIAGFEDRGIFQSSGSNGQGGEGVGVAAGRQTNRAACHF